MRNNKVSKHITLNTLGVLCKANGFTLAKSDIIFNKYVIKYKDCYVCSFRPQLMKAYGSPISYDGNSFFVTYSLKKLNKALIAYALKH